MLSRTVSFIAQAEGVKCDVGARRGIVVALNRTSETVLLTPQILSLWHAELLQFCSNSEVGGRRRETAVFRRIGTIVEFYLDYWLVDEYLLTLCDYVNTFITTGKCLATRTRSHYKACVFYYRQLLLIHPFRDGNGRLAWIFFFWFYGSVPGANWLQQTDLSRVLWACKPDYDWDIFSCNFDQKILFDFFDSIK